MSEESKTYFWVLADNIFPGNRYFRLKGKSYYFNRNMPLEVRGYELRLHRETVDKVPGFFPSTFLMRREIFSCNPLNILL